MGDGISIVSVYNVWVLKSRNTKRIFKNSFGEL